MAIKKVLFLTLILILIGLPSLADINLGQKLAGKILLQVEQNGEAWYVNPLDAKKYYLGQPNDAFNIMRELGVGITNNNLNKIPIGIIANLDQDNDKDGLGNRLEDALLTDKNNADSDNDGHSDYDEIINNYNPTGTGKILIDENFVKKNTGKIFLQIEQNGEAWYVNPNDLKRYYLSRPDTAFALMRQFGLGISNIDINKIPTNIISNNKSSNPNISNNPNTPNNPSCTNCNEEKDGAIRNNNYELATNYFHPSLHARLEYSLNALSAEGRLTLGNILSGSTLTSETDDKLTYKNDVYFSLGGYSVPIEFYVEKELDGNWYLVNL